MALRSSSALSRSLVRQQGARLRAAPRRQLSGDAKSEGAAGWYERMLESHPMPTKAASSALIAASGDAICQIGVEDHPFDFERFGRFVVLGGALVGPTLHFWCVVVVGRGRPRSRAAAPSHASPPRPCTPGTASSSRPSPARRWRRRCSG
jgi:hypothetical protein